MGDPLYWLGFFFVATTVVCAILIFRWDWSVQQWRDAKARILIANRRRLNHPKPSPRPVPAPIRRMPQNFRSPAPPQPPLRQAPSRQSYRVPPQQAAPRQAPLRQNGHRSAHVAENAYSRTDSLLTPGERAFYQALRKAVGDTWHISMKTRLADLVQIKFDPRHPYKAFNQVAQKHIDFVLADHNTQAPILLVELDDKTHRRQKRKERDAFVNSLCRGVGLKIIHIKARVDYSPQKIRYMLDDRLRRA